MNHQKQQLLKSAARLTRLGLDVDAARETLRQLAARGVPYDSEEMLRAYERFTELDRQWRELEQKHLSYFQTCCLPRKPWRENHLNSYYDFTARF